MQCRLFPLLEEEIGEITEKLQEFLRIIEFVKPVRFITGALSWCGLGRRLQNRENLLQAYFLKSVYNLPTTKVGTYMQRIFISNNRIEKYDGENVTFRYTESGSGQTVRRIMSALVFIKMFLRHVLPSDFYGLLGSARKKTLKDIRIMILTSRGQAPSESEEFIAYKVKCSKCGAAMILSSVGARAPSREAIVI